jgi:hypothetical protein
MNDKLTARLRHLFCNAEEPDTTSVGTRSGNAFLKSKLD